MVEKNITTIPILDAFERKAGCPLCFIWSKGEASYLEYIMTNEVTMNPEFREKVVNATGFCNRHMHLLYRYAFSGHGEDGLGYAMYAKDVIDKLDGRLDGLRSSLPVAMKGTKHRSVFIRGRVFRRAIQQSIDELDNAIRGSTICPLCDMLLESDRRMVSTFLKMLEDETFANLFVKSNGICLPHFVSAMDSLLESGVKPEKVVNLLVQGELGSLKRIGHLLSERMRKYSWDFRGEKITAEEVSSQEAALNAIAGVEGLYCRTRKVGSSSALKKC